MRAIGRNWQVAAGKLVRALRARLDDGEAVLDGKIDGLVIADLEMQAGVLLDRAPIAAEQRVACR